MAHPDDILIVSNLHEAREYRQFTQRQIASVSMPSRLYGRRFRIAWRTDLALDTRGWNKMYDILRLSLYFGGVIRHISEWKPPVINSLRDTLPFGSIPDIEDAKIVVEWFKEYLQGVDDVQEALDAIC